MKKTVIAALLGTALLTGGAMAAAQDQTQPQDAPKRHRMMHDPLTMADINKDGIVTRDEVAASVAARFARLDTNKDGKITPEERHAARAAMRARMGRDEMDKGVRGPGMRHHGPDTDGDGAVSLDEQRARALKRFDFIDRNGDGKVDQAERQLVREMIREMTPRGRHGGHGLRSGGPDMPPRPHAPAGNGS
ncbi:MAG: ca2+ sensor protein [Sphingomonas sp.]|uniref:EF-hand domain-containing protein n=1 Tax=Sphingomonas sp. TaxID=28214 RepID=UPI0025E08EA7|nr:ca2+ sensor protein [Sphingomonas sp.]MBX3564725.1 ca2+ sensor protein [Sphingomonas sp.]